MNVLLKSVKIIHEGSSVNGKTRDIFIKDGIISKIAEKLDEKTTGKSVKIMEGKGNCVSIGWFDMKANFRDPGHEQKEDIFSGMKAAAAGGFTGVAIMPSTHPVLQTKADIEYIVNKSRNHLVDVHPVGALSVNCDGKEMTDMFDMKQAGAVAFSDDKRSLMDAGFMMRSLLYAKNIETLIIAFADERTISVKNVMNESLNSVYFGMKGSPAIGEDLLVQRDIKLCEYTGGKIHFSTVSSAGAVELIRKAKKNGLQVTAEVCAHQLCFDDATLSDYDTNYKVKPPFRTKVDIKALVRGLEDGTIDAICSDHSPEDIESKDVEFEFANYGIIGLETAFASAHTQLHRKLSLAAIVEKFTSRPRHILNIDIPEIKEGAAANLTVFNPDAEWVFTKQHIHSKSANTPFLNQKFKGRAMAVINNGKVLELV